WKAPAPSLALGAFHRAGADPGSAVHPRAVEPRDFGQRVAEAIMDQRALAVAAEDAAIMVLGLDRRDIAGGDPGTGEQAGIGAHRPRPAQHQPGDGPADREDAQADRRRAQPDLDRHGPHLDADGPAAQPD
ncbi:hypothetical protein QU38_00385, partial [Staphylococcus aureus]